MILKFFENSSKACQPVAPSYYSKQDVIKGLQRRAKNKLGIRTIDLRKTADLDGDSPLLRAIQKYFNSHKDAFDAAQLEKPKRAPIAKKHSRRSHS